MELPIRYIARILIEAASPISLGSGESSITCDKLVLKGINGLPIIPGTSLAGVLRHSFEDTVDKKIINSIFGYQGEKKKGQEHAEGKGSRLIVSSAYFVGRKEKVFEGTEVPDWANSFYKFYKKLPVRQHVRMSEKGAAQKHGKFDEEIVYKGTRFIFDLELKGTKTDKDHWEKLISQLLLKEFRIGSGTRKGFGSIKVKNVWVAEYDLETEEGRSGYINKSSSLNNSFPGRNLTPENPEEKWSHYQLKLKPVDLFLFSSGQGSDEADINPVKEHIIVWKKNEPEISPEMILIPGASVKGAIAHRTAYHYNKIKGITAEKLQKEESVNDLVKNGYFPIEPNFDGKNYEHRVKLATEYNPAVIELFGFSSDCTFEINGIKKSRGKVILSDVFLESARQKLLNHVSIDRFTGGAIDGALYSELVNYNDTGFELDLYLNETEVTNRNAIVALENALQDIVKGMLPLGGGTMRGHGCFEGEVLKNQKVLKNE